MLTKKNSLFLILVLLLAAVVYWKVTEHNKKVPEESYKQPITSQKQTTDRNLATAEPVQDETVIASRTALSSKMEDVSNAQQKPESIHEIAEDEILKRKAELDAIEKDMMLSPSPEGDVSYMSPEYETNQPVGEVDFPAVEPESIYTELGEQRNNSEKIGEPIEQ